MHDVTTRIAIRCAAVLACLGLLAAGVQAQSPLPKASQPAFGDVGAASTIGARQMLADFEDGTGGLFGAQTGIVASAHLDGKALVLGKGRLLRAGSPAIAWMKYNLLRLDAYNPSDQPAQLYLCWVDDSDPHGYFSWINRYVSVRPGRSTVELNIAALQRGEGSPKDMLDPRPFLWDQVRRFDISLLSGLIEVDNIRLEKMEIPKVAGVLAFDFGPAGAPAAPGTEPVTPGSLYTDAAGYGWTRTAGLAAQRRSRPPDSFVGDWISGQGAVFSAKVPDGKYRVWMIWEDPGQWELYPFYTSRNISSGGKVLLSDTQNGEQFLDRYFHFAETEDLPGDDIYGRYLEWRYPPRTFTAEAMNGRLDLTINGSGTFAATVNGMVIYPESLAQEGEAYIRFLQDWRRHEFFSTWTEVLPRRTGLDAGLAKDHAARGFVVFQRKDGKDVGIWDAPAAGEVLPEPAALAATVARGRTESVGFSVHALADLTQVVARMGEFANEHGETLPREAVSVETVRYKFKCVGFNSAGVYSSVPWLLVDGGTNRIPAHGNRTYYVTVHAPESQEAGVYRGRLTLTANGREFGADVAVRVLPFALPEADVALGMFGMGGVAPSTAYYPENEARNKADKERALAYARDVGFTHISIGGVTVMGYTNQQARLDFSAAQKEYAVAQQAGFSFIDLHAMHRTFYWAAHDEGELAKANGFNTVEGLIKGTFGPAIAQARALGLPDPIWCFGDEPPESAAAEYVKMHRRLRELAGARSTVCWSPSGEKTRELLDVTGICDLNAVSATDLARAKAAGNTIYLNNQGANRWAFGLYMWKAHQAGVQGHRQFAWISGHADIYYPLDSVEDDQGVVYADRQGRLRPVTALVRIRQGIDDYRYTLALAQAIEKGRHGTAEQQKTAAEAQAYLDSVMTKIRFEDTGRDRAPQMSEAELDSYRARVQEYLSKLAM